MLYKNSCFYKRLDIAENEFRQLLIYKYFYEKKTHKQIAIDLNCCKESIDIWFIFLKIPSHGNRLPRGVGACNGLYASYRKSAQKRKINFDINIEEFKCITSQNCYYCGNIPKQIYAAKNKYKSGDYIYNGIDRLNNNLGYIISNIVPCCKICNTMKWSLSLDDFKKHITVLYQRLCNNG